MKFMISWEMHQGSLHETLAAFTQMTVEQEQAMMGEHVKLIGRWHDLVRGTGVAIYEANDASALSAYAMRWNEHMDFDIALVTDDEETREIGRRMS